MNAEPGQAVWIQTIGAGNKRDACCVQQLEQLLLVFELSLAILHFSLAATTRILRRRNRSKARGTYFRFGLS